MESLEWNKQTYDSAKHSVGPSNTPQRKIRSAVLKKREAILELSEEALPQQPTDALLLTCAQALTRGAL